GTIECDIAVSNYSLEAIVKYKKNGPSKENMGALKNSSAGTRRVFMIGFKNFKGKVGHTWSQICWNAFTHSGWASGCTGP
ncbi:MAG: hypothetical protein ACRDJ3_08020, partial [Solirubrobacteraceae bacterium]